jgi:hypothetical protein
VCSGGDRKEVQTRETTACDAGDMCFDAHAMAKARTTALLTAIRGGKLPPETPNCDPVGLAKQMSGLQ